VVLGAPRGAMTADLSAGRHLVCVAGGTGLAPLKALVQAVVTARAARTASGRPAITMYVGARSGSDLYDLQDLAMLALGYPPLAVIPVEQDRRPGALVGAAAAHASFKDTDVYVSGPVGLVEATVAALRPRVPPGRLHHDPVELLRDAAANAPTAYNNELSDNFTLLSPALR
jgi:NAD(P)H-flavin reductase